MASGAGTSEAAAWPAKGQPAMLLAGALDLCASGEAAAFHSTVNEPWAGQITMGRPCAWPRSATMKPAGNISCSTSASNAAAIRTGRGLELTERRAADMARLIRLTPVGAKPRIENATQKPSLNENYYRIQRRQGR